MFIPYDLIVKIDCLRLRDKIASQIKSDVVVLKSRGVTPAFAIIQIGNYPPSDTYVRVKMKKAKELGINVKIYKFSQNQKSKIKNQNDSPRGEAGNLKIKNSNICENPPENLKKLKLPLYNPHSIR